MKCKICLKDYNNFRSFSGHMRNHNIKIKEYYDKFLKNKTEGKCLECGKETEFLSLPLRYNRYCSLKCSNNNKNVKIKKEETSLKHFGVKIPSQSREIKEKTKQNYLSKYGVESHNQLNSVKEKKKQTCLKKYGVENPNQVKRFRNKTKKTCLKKYGFESPRQNEKVKEKSRQTCLNKYGVEFTGQSQQKKTNCIKTCLNKYGVENTLQSEEIKKRIKQTMLDKYGVENPSQLERFQEQKRATCLQKYGEDNWSKTPQGRKMYRENFIRRVEKQKLNGEPLTPCIGNNERKCLNELQKHIKKYKIERCPKIIGFYPDGWVRGLNLDIEFDERNNHNIRHTSKDNKRDSCFRNEGFYVFRIKEKDWYENKQFIINSFLKLIKKLETNII